ncbi:MAG: cupin-like domain-containing protein [Sandaracinaceae bacterium]|nr:MAG: cupin-like domain-containing protein [Sandaracinaceae bacterium]
MAKKRKARAAGAVLSFEWRRWAADNLLRGASPEKVRAALEAEGVPPKEARSRVDAILASPVFAAATAHAREARRLGQVVKMQARARDTAEQPIARVEAIDAGTFYERFYATGSPLLVEGYARDWPAAAWTLETFRTRWGDAEVRITEGREADPYYDMRSAEHTRTSTMRALVDRIEATDASNDFYMVANNKNLDDPALAGVRDDLRLDDGILDPTRFRGCTALWLGPAGTVTPLHHDTSNILFVQLRGRKRFRLFAPWETSLFEGATAMYAAVDPERDHVSARELLVELGPGDALFLPVGWWHHVRALEASISLAFVGFHRDNEFDWYRPGSV